MMHPERSAQLQSMVEEMNRSILDVVQKNGCITIAELITIIIPNPKSKLFGITVTLDGFQAVNLKAIGVSLTCVQEEANFVIDSISPGSQTMSLDNSRSGGIQISRLRADVILNSATFSIN